MKSKTKMVCVRMTPEVHRAAKSKLVQIDKTFQAFFEGKLCEFVELEAA
jgi:hypothetical protein